MTAQPHRVRRYLAALLAVTLVAAVAACTHRSPAPATPTVTAHVVPVGAVAPVDAASWALADRLARPNFTADTTAALVAGLARSGVGTFADPSATNPDQPVAGPVSALRVLGFQAHALAVGAWAGAGFTGSELDGVLPLPAGAVGLATTSQLLAGYVAAAATPGAALSRALMAGQNLLAPAALRFPGVVLVLFVADIAADIAAAGTAGAAGPDPAGPASTVPAAVTTAAGAVGTGAAIPARFELPRRAGGGICATAATWVENTIVGFFRALRVATPANLPGAIVVTIWNWLLGAGEAFVRNLITTATEAVLGTIRIMAAGISAVATQLAALLPYAVAVTASGDGGGATFVLGPAPLAGRFTARVSAGDLPSWPAVLTDCAEVAKIPLPDFHTTAVPLSWGPLETPPDPLLAASEPGHTTDVLDGAGQATWGFVTSKDPGDPAGEQRSQVIAMPVAVHRPELDQARQRLTTALLGNIPELLQPFVTRLFAPYLDGLQTRLNLLLDARGRGTAYLVYHAGTPPTPSHPAPTGSGACATRAAPGRYTGTNTNTFTETIPRTGGAVVDHNTATGPVALTVAADQTLRGTWSFQMHDVLDENMVISGVSANYHSERIWTMTAGTVTGTVCDPGLTSSVVVQVSCTGACGNGAAHPAPAGVQPSLGPPLAGPAGQLTWQVRRDAPDGAYTDTFTITVAGPAG